MAERCETCGQWLPGDRPHTCGEPNPRPPTIWPPSRVAHLLELNAAGMSAAGIAAELGCTKSMVIGKLYREVGPKPKPPRPPKPPAPPPVPASIPATLTNPCIEITDPSPEQLAEFKPEAPPPANRPPRLARKVAGQRYAATGMLARFKKKQELTERAPLASGAPIAVPAANPVTIFDLTGFTCRWPLWPETCMAVSEQLYCGAQAIEIGRYCAKHSAAAYNNKARS